MLIRDKDMTALSMVARDGSRHPIRAVLLDPDALAVEALEIDIGGWFEGETAVIDVSRFGAPEVETGSWPAAVEQDALASADGTRSLGEADPARLRRAEEVVTGQAVRAADGEFGHLMGLIFESEGWRAAYLVVETGGSTMLAENQRVIPVSAVVGDAIMGGDISLEGNAGDYADTPDLHQLDGVEGKWYNKVLAYYGLQS